MNLNQIDVNILTMLKKTAARPGDFVNNLGFNEALVFTLIN